MNNTSINTNRWILYILLAIAVYTLYPFIHTGFATSDDFEYFITCQNGKIWEGSFYYAKMSGRFYLMITMPIHYLFHSFNNITLAKLFHMCFIFLNYAVFGLIIKEIFNNKWIGYLTFLLGIVFISIKGENNAVVSYPFYFSVPFLFIELSIYTAFKFYKTAEKKYIYICSLLYISGLLFYEDYLIYAPLCFIFLIYNSLADSSLDMKQKVLKAFKDSYPLIAVVLLYLIFYVVFRKLFSDTTYRGSSVASSVSVSDFFKVVTKLSKGAYPLFYYFTGRPVFYSESTLIYGHKQDFVYFLNHIKIEWLYKALVVSGVFYYITQKIQPVSNKKILAVIAVAFVYIYLPQFILGVTEKYIYAANEWGTDNYVTTYFSVFPVALIMALVFILLKQTIVSALWKKVLLYTLTGIIAMGSMLNDYINAHVVADLEGSVNTVQAIDALVETTEFKSIANDAFIYSPQLYKSNTGSSMIHADLDWSNYFNMRTKKQLTVSKFYKDLKDVQQKGQHPVYFINYGHNKKGIDQFFALSRLSQQVAQDSLQENFMSDSVTVFYYSSFKTFSISFYCKKADQDSTMIVNGEKLPMNKAYTELFVEYENGNDFFKPIQIKARNIDLKSVQVFHNNTSTGVPVRIK